jgi:hypothetical protein
VLIDPMPALLHCSAIQTGQRSVHRRANLGNTEGIVHIRMGCVQNGHNSGSQQEPSSTLDAIAARIPKRIHQRIFAE